MVTWLCHMTLEAITWRRISFSIEIPSIIYKRADILYHRPDLKMFILGQISSKITVFFKFCNFFGYFEKICIEKWHISSLTSEFDGPKSGHQCPLFAMTGGNRTSLTGRLRQGKYIFSTKGQKWYYLDRLIELITNLYMLSYNWNDFKRFRPLPDKIAVKDFDSKLATNDHIGVKYGSNRQITYIIGTSSLRRFECAYLHKWAEC